VTPLAAALLAACPTQAPSLADGGSGAVLGAAVVEVCVVGGQDHERESMTLLMQHELDAGLTVERASEDLETLVGTGWIRDARALAVPLEKGRVQLVYAVEPYPSLVTVAVKGGRAVNPDTSFHTGRPTSAVNVRAGVDALKERYAALGYPNAHIDWKLEAADGGVTLALDVSEGVRFTVAAVRFSGNQRVGLPKLRNVIKTQLGDVFSHDVVADDAQAMTAVLLDQGLLEGSVATPEAKELSGKPGQIDVVYAVKEGPIYRASAVSLNGWEYGPPPLALLETKKGQPFSAAGANRDIDRLRHQAAEHGAEIDVTILTSVDSKAHSVSVGFEVSKHTPGWIKF
jgi:outer membrane protein assembly factor BamA